MAPLNLHRSCPVQVRRTALALKQCRVVISKRELLPGLAALKASQVKPVDPAQFLSPSNRCVHRSSAGTRLKHPPPEGCRHMRPTPQRYAHRLAPDLFRPVRAPRTSAFRGQTSPSPESPETADGVVICGPFGE